MDTTPAPSLREAVDRTLATILDPEYGVPITDLGLVYRVDIIGGRVDIALTLTTPSCPAGSVIVEGVRSAIEAIPEVEVCLVFLEWDPPWTPDRLSPAARAQLGWEG